jgi:hypothetical protein
MATAAATLTTIDTAIETRLTTGELVTEFTINGRTVRYETLDALMRLRSLYEKLAAREARKNSTGTLLARFRRP